MLLATEIPTDEERAAVAAVVPCGLDLYRLTGTVRAALDNQSIDLIDAALGPNHARAAVVALYEALDVLLQATTDVAESAGEAIFTRVQPFDPLKVEREALLAPAEKRFPFRVARYAVEDAAVRAASAGDRMANAFVRLAWEANAARLRASDEQVAGSTPSRSRSSSRPLGRTSRCLHSPACAASWASRSRPRYVRPGDLGPRGPLVSNRRRVDHGLLRQRPPRKGPDLNRAPSRPTTAPPREPDPAPFLRI